MTAWRKIAEAARFETVLGRLDNGLEIHIVPRHTVPVVTTMVFYRVGSVDEAEGETGLAHFLEHMMFKGTDRYAVGEIDRLTLAAGGSNNAFTSYDYTGYYLDLPASTWTRALEIEANRMTGCTFAPDEVENERSVVLSELDGDRDNPSRSLIEEVGALAYKVHRYRHPIIGWRDEVAAVDRARMVDFYARAYHPANAVLVIVGAVDPATALGLAETHFGAIPARPRLERVYTSEPPQEGERRLVLKPAENPVDRLALAYHGVRIGADHDHALDLAAAILSSGRASRLVRALVDEERLAAGVHAANDSRLFPGLFEIAATAAPGVELARLEAAIERQVARLAAEPPAAEELERARALVTAAHLASLETTGEVAYHVGMFAAIGHADAFATYLSRMADVTAEEITEAVSRILVRERCTVGWSLASAASDS